MLGTPCLPVGSWAQCGVRPSWAWGLRCAAGHSTGTRQAKSFPLLAGTSIPGAGSDMRPPATGTPSSAPTPRVADVPSSRPCCAELAAGKHPGTAWGHRLLSPNWPQTLPNPVGQPCSRSMAGSPKFSGSPPALPVPASPSGAGSTWVPQPWGTPRFWPRPLVGPAEGRARQTWLEPNESPPREAAGARTRLAPTPPRLPSTAGAPETMTPPPPPSLSSHAAPRSRGAGPAAPHPDLP